MNKLIIGLIVFILGSVIAYLINKYVNNDLNLIKSKYFNCFVTAIGGIAYGLVYFKYSINVYSVLLCLLSSVLLLIAVYDYSSCEIKDSFLIICLIVCVVLFIYNVFYSKERVGDYIFSLVMTLIFFASLILFAKFVLKKDALGSGDIYLACIISIIFKPFVMIVSILIGSFTGCVIEIIKIKSKKTNIDNEIAFCPYLCFGFFTALLFSSEIINLL